MTGGWEECGDSATALSLRHPLSHPLSQHPLSHPLSQHDCTNPLSHPLSQHDHPLSQHDHPLSQHDHPLSQHDHPLSHPLRQHADWQCPGVVELGEDRVRQAAALISDAVKGKFDPHIVNDSTSMARHRLYTVSSKLRFALLGAVIALTWFEHPMWCGSSECPDAAVYVRSQLSVLSYEVSLTLEMVVLLLLLALDDGLRVSFQGVREWAEDRVNVVRVGVHVGTVRVRWS